LPPGPETLLLVNEYFSNSALLFPYVYEESFLIEYKEFERSNFQKVRMSWLAPLYMIMAIAIYTTDEQMTPEDRAAASEAYYRKALEMDIYDSLAIDLMQGDNTLTSINDSQSPISPIDGSVSSGNAKISSNMGTPWAGGKVSISARNTFI
jgi:hypothetical protein